MSFAAIVDVTGGAGGHQRARTGAVGRDLRDDAQSVPAGTFHVSCALLIGRRTESTDKKTSLNDVLRTFNVQV